MIGIRWTYLGLYYLCTSYCGWVYAFSVWRSVRKWVGIWGIMRLVSNSLEGSRCNMNHFIRD